MIEWRSCYELPRTCSWRHGANGEIIVARVDGSVESISSDEFSRKYISRRPAPAEYRDYLRSCEAEITRLRAGLQKIVEGDGFWDAPSLARDLLEGKDVT
jgi:hypothetical protein